MDEKVVEEDIKFQEDFDKRHGFFGRFPKKFYGVMILKEGGELLNLLWKIERAVTWKGESIEEALQRFGSEICEEAADTYAYVLKTLVELFDRKVPEIKNFSGDYRDLMLLLYEKLEDLKNLSADLLGDIIGVLQAISRLCNCDLHESYRKKMAYNERRFVRR